MAIAPHVRDVAASRARLADAVIRHHGEPVILPSGEARGVFYPFPGEPGGLPSSVGLRMMIERQQAPELHLLPADAAGIKRNDPITAHGRDWLAVAPAADVGDVLMAVELMPASSVGHVPPDQPWQ